jgi:hypothetical protein
MEEMILQMMKCLPVGQSGKDEVQAAANEAKADAHLERIKASAEELGAQHEEILGQGVINIKPENLKVGL